MTVQIRDNEISSPIPGFLALIVILAVQAACAYVALTSFGHSLGTTIGSAIIFLISLFFYSGLTTINPGEAVLLIFFGNYVGTVRTSGFFWFNIFYSSQKVTTKQVNRVTEVLKINDASGNPIEVAATIS